LSGIRHLCLSGRGLHRLTCDAAGDALRVRHSVGRSDEAETTQQKHVDGSPIHMYLVDPGAAPVKGRRALRGKS
jgi:hypothetical protein